MNIIEVIILAAVQALTEFLPVSSSGHLLIAADLGHIPSSLAFDVMLHLGTLAALVIYFWTKLWAIVTDFVSGRDRRLLIKLLISSVPAALAGALFNDFFTNDVRSLNVVVAMLVVIGLVLIAADKLFPKKNNQSLANISNKTAFFIGCAQAIALIPGTSRSGITILAGRAKGLSNELAAEYSFLIGVPIIFGASLQTLADSATRSAIADQLAQTILGITVAAFLGVIVIRWLLSYLKSHSLAIFGYYRIALALVLLLLINT